MGEKPFYFFLMEKFGKFYKKIFQKLVKKLTFLDDMWLPNFCSVPNVTQLKQFVLT